MELVDYLYGLRRFWYVVLACTLVGLFGAWTYNYLTLLDEASTSVAVVSPLAARQVSGTTEAQVTFAAIIKSYTLATAVAKRVGENPDDVYSRLSVSTDSSSGGGSSGSG